MSQQSQACARLHIAVKLLSVFMFHCFPSGLPLTHSVTHQSDGKAERCGEMSITVSQPSQTKAEDFTKATLYHSPA